MLKKSVFLEIKKEFERFDEKREEVIQQSREIIQLSKKIIYAIIREDKKISTEGMKDIKKKIKALPEKSYDAGIQKVAVQEYVEAATLYYFIYKNNMPSKEELDVDSESYLLGLCDLTGELVRIAVNLSIKGKHKEIVKIRDLVSDIYANFLELNLRNGELRRKSDSIKWNLNKIEDLLSQISIHIGSNKRSKSRN